MNGLDSSAALGMTNWVGGEWRRDDGLGVAAPPWVPDRGPEWRKEGSGMTRVDPSTSLRMKVGRARGVAQGRRFVGCRAPLGSGSGSGKTVGGQNDGKGGGGVGVG